jgi:Fe-S-cluster containining protein
MEWSLLRRGQQPASGHEEALPCFWLELETKRCKHYKYRPEVCRDHFCGQSLEEIFRIAMPVQKEKTPHD